MMGMMVNAAAARCGRSACLATVLMASLATSAEAQSTPETVQDILAFLVTNRGVETGDFDKDREAAEATSATLTRALLAAIARVPISTSSSGFTYRLNPTLGTVERASETFGPFFAERALTSGAGQASFGVTFQYASFTTLDGNDLRDGSFVTTANQFRDEETPFDIETLTLNITTRTTTVFGSVGVTDRLDVAAAVPFVSLGISGSRVNTYRGTSVVQARATAETTVPCTVPQPWSSGSRPDAAKTSSALVMSRSARQELRLLKSARRRSTAMSASVAAVLVARSASEAPWLTPRLPDSRWSARCLRGVLRAPNGSAPSSPRTRASPASRRLDWCRSATISSRRLLLRASSGM
jgi:hypothetical protein